jgi:epoxyqueuosine reductase
MRDGILKIAQNVGASLAGITDVESLPASPTYHAYAKMELPESVRSILVVALRHGLDKPELDWWDDQKGGSPGNRILIDMADTLIQHLSDAFNLNAQQLPYHTEKGGIFLKDAAVLAGLGIIGKNNLLITREFGPRVRLRALTLDLKIEPKKPAHFNPCEDCPTICWSLCPQNAFSNDSYSKTECERQMKEDVKNKAEPGKPSETQSAKICIKYCRECELGCPIGS